MCPIGINAIFNDYHNKITLKYYLKCYTYLMISMYDIYLLFWFCILRYGQHETVQGSGVCYSGIRDDK